MGLLKLYMWLCYILLGKALALNTEVTCPQLYTPDNGYMSGNGLDEGAVVRFGCIEGFKVIGSSERLCQADGQWSGQTTTCEEQCQIPALSKSGGWVEGLIDFAYVDHGTEIQIECKDSKDDVKPRQSFSAKCFNGTWSRPVDCRIGATCPLLTAPENGHMSGNGSGQSAVIRFECDVGYVIIGSSVRLCQADGQWSGQTPKCEVVKCPRLLTPAKGYITRYKGDPSIRPGYGTVIEYGCAVGYKLFGPSDRLCQADGQWSGQTTLCKEVDCGWPGPFHNGYIIGDRTTYGSRIFFSCDMRSNLDGKTFHTECLHTGEWSNAPPICWPKCTTPPLKLRHGQYVSYGTSHGSQAVYRCFRGYRLTGMNKQYLTCEFGEWRGGTPVCKRYTCLNPGRIANANVFLRSGKGLTYLKSTTKILSQGKRLQIICDAGYMISGPQSTTCIEDGEWQPSIASTKCEPADRLSSTEDVETIA